MEKFEFIDEEKIDGEFVDGKLKKYVPHFKAFLNKRRPIYEAIRALSQEDLEFFTTKEDDRIGSNSAACAVFITLVIESHPGTQAAFKNDCQGHVDELHMLANVFAGLCNYALLEKSHFLKVEAKGKKLSKIKNILTTLNPMFMQLCESKGIDLDSRESLESNLQGVLESIREFELGSSS